jgi:hypothetical protein
MPSAKADIFEIHAWMLEEYSEMADRWLWNCSWAITSLGEFPERCKISDETRAFDVEIRELLFGEKRNVFRVLFSISANKVAILRVRSTRQQRLIDQMDEEE